MWPLWGCLVAAITEFYNCTRCCARCCWYIYKLLKSVIPRPNATKKHCPACLHCSWPAPVLQFSNARWRYFIWLKWGHFCQACFLILSLHLNKKLHQPIAKSYALRAGVRDSNYKKYFSEHCQWNFYKTEKYDWYYPYCGKIYSQNILITGHFFQIVLHNIFYVVRMVFSTVLVTLIYHHESSSFFP